MVFGTLRLRTSLPCPVPLLFVFVCVCVCVSHQKVHALCRGIVQHLKALFQARLLAYSLRSTVQRAQGYLQRATESHVWAWLLCLQCDLTLKLCSAWLLLRSAWSVGLAAAVQRGKRGAWAVW